MVFASMDRTKLYSCSLNVSMYLILEPAPVILQNGSSRQHCQGCSGSEVHLRLGGNSVYHDMMAMGDAVLGMSVC